MIPEKLDPTALAIIVGASMAMIGTAVCIHLYCLFRDWRHRKSSDDFWGDQIGKDDT